jgi:hypothetical protein
MTGEPLTMAIPSTGSLAKGRGDSGGEITTKRASLMGRVNSASPTPSWSIPVWAEELSGLFVTLENFLIER